MRVRRPNLAPLSPDSGNLSGLRIHERLKGVSAISQRAPCRVDERRKYDQHSLHEL